MMRNVMVTGSNGFIGKHLVNALIDNGCAVTGVVRTQPEKVDPNCNVVVRDIVEEANWQNVFQNTEYIVHLGDGLNVLEKAQKSEADAAKICDANVWFAKNAFESGISKFVYVSSVKAMVDECADGLLTERTTPKPTSLYGRSKLRLEESLADHAHRSGTQFVVIRPPLVFGSEAVGNFARLLRLAQSGWPLPFATLNGKRSMIHVGQLGRALTASVVGGQGREGAYLVHGGASLSVSQVVGLLREGFGQARRLFPLPGLSLLRRLPQLRPSINRLMGSLELDDRKYRSDFSWEPDASNEELLRNCAQDYRTAKQCR